MWLKSSFLVAMAAWAVLAATPARAQLPQVQLPNLGGPTAPIPDAAGALGQVQTAAGDLTRARGQDVRRLLRRNRDVLEADPQGAPIVRRQIMTIAPSPAVIAAAEAAGFTVVRRERLTGVDADIVVLRAPEIMSTAAARARLQAIDPNGAYDFNHIYLESGSPRATGTAQTPQAPSDGVFTRARIGLIDGAVAAHPAFVDGQITQRAFAGPRIVPSAHGTSVASLLAGRTDRFRGAAPGAHLYVADVYGGEADGGSAAALALALSWLAQQQTPVINISLVGPYNRVLERIVGAMISRGYVIVAAVGNDGPAAPPLYPAAYDGVVGVTGVDARGRVLIEAERGSQVDFAAIGVGSAAALRGWSDVRGTSFAAPVVAGLLAREINTPDPQAARAALTRLAAHARDLGVAGRDPIYGAGWVGGGSETAAR